MRHFIGLLILASIFFECTAQTFDLNKGMIPVSTKSPEAANLGKFGNIPVSYFTGIPSITIPVYEINIGSIKLPISLDYHAGGIRVEETSSSVGLGWALNGIGVISRNVVGRPDELQGGYIGAPNAADVTFNDVLFLYDARDGFSDTEPDIFQYNVNGLSGKFIFRNDGTVMQIPVTNNRITFSNGNFTITDASGNVYFFAEKRKNYNDEGTGGYPPEYISTWCITKMTGSNSIDDISFSYNTDRYEVYETITSFTASAGSTPACGGSGSMDSFVGQVIPYNAIPKTSVHDEYYPAEIKWRGGKIAFGNVEDRQDVLGKSIRLDAIKVYGIQNGQSNLIKNTRLNQSYFISVAPAGHPVSDKNYRLKLDAVENLDVITNAPVQVYKLKYNDTPLPPRGSYAQDRFGFNNGHTENPSLMQAQQVSYNGQPHWLGDANRETDETAILAGTLSSIEYPTKGKTVFELESHRFSTLPAGIGGGLRVKSITNYGVDGNFINKEIYQYGTDGTGTMITPVFLQEIRYETVIKRLGCGGNPCTYFTAITNPGFTTIYRANSVHAASQYGGSPVVYEKVTKIQVNASGAANGKTVYGSTVYTDNFELPGHVGYSQGRAGLYVVPNAWKNGFLQYEEIYKSTASGYQLVSKKVNNYSVHQSESHNVLKVRSEYAHSGCEGKSVTTASQDFNVQVIPVHTGAMLLDALTSTLRDDNGNEVVNTQTFDYEGNTPLLPSTIETSSSDGDVLTQHLTYPLDWSAPGNVYQKMVGRNMLSSVVQEQKLRNENQLAFIKVSYNDWFGNSKLLLPQSVTEQVGIHPEEIRVLFNAYDEYGNILEQRKSNDVSHTFLWGYSRSLPIAHITNCQLTWVEETQTVTMPTMQVPGTLSENYVTVKTGIDIRFGQDVKVSCTVNRGMAGAGMPDHYFNVTLSVLDQQTQTEVYSGSFGLTTQSTYSINDLPAGLYTLQYRYDGNIGSENAFSFTSSLEYQFVFANVFYSSFEEDTENTSADAYTGRKSHAGVYSVNLPRQTGDYVLSYWTKQVGGPWTRNDEVINITPSSAHFKTIGSSGILVDEVRIYPRGAQMTTYTYDPLLGMTSSSDVNNSVERYQYDGLGRLKLVRDAEGNITKQFQYNYIVK
jgi:YD repeat-containing protein